MSDQRNARIRSESFAFLQSLVVSSGEVIDRAVLERGFLFEGYRVPLIGPQGIFKPAQLTDAPLSITTAPQVEGRQAPYDDRFEDDGSLLYRYRGTDPEHHENRGLRRALRESIPLVYLRGLVRGRYMAAFPAFIIGDNPSELCFRVQVDDMGFLAERSDSLVSEDSEARRKYVTVTTLKRMHQQSFRERVVAAYRKECAVCSLRHERLLDAAHILPDRHPLGEPRVCNGLSLCKLHHAAFDQGILGIQPDRIIQIREDVLREIDGPMLRHGLQEFQGRKIRIPTQKELQPRPEYLEERFAAFRRTA